MNECRIPTVGRVGTSSRQVFTQLWTGTTVLSVDAGTPYGASPQSSQLLRGSKSIIMLFVYTDLSHAQEALKHQGH